MASRPPSGNVTQSGDRCTEAGDGWYCGQLEARVEKEGGVLSTLIRGEIKHRGSRRALGTARVLLHPRQCGGICITTERAR